MEKSIEFEHGNKDLRFTPEISKQSRAIMLKRTHNKEFQKVEDRLLGYIKKNKEAEETKEKPAEKQSSISSVKKPMRCKTVTQPVENVHTFNPIEDNSDMFSFKRGTETSNVFEEQRTPELKSKVSQNSFFEVEVKKLTINEPVVEVNQSQNSQKLSLQDSVKNISSTNQSTMDYKSPPAEVQMKKPKKLIDKENIAPQEAEISRKPAENQSKQTPPSKKPSPAPTIRSLLSMHTTNKSFQSSMQSSVVLKPALSKSPTPKPQPQTQPAQQPSPVTKPSKSSVNTRYTNINKQVIDSRDIQDSICGPTTSMLEKIKKINNNLRKANGLECIIKQKDPQDLAKPTDTEDNIFLRHVERAKEPQNPPTSLVTRPKPSLLTAPIHVHPN